ncbi:MAG: ribonuclease HI [bacterium]
MEKIIIFSDGSSKGNPGPGGWGVIIIFDDKVIEFGGKENYTTNNRMELSGAINALSFLENLFKNKSIFNLEEKIILNTDSLYIINGITKWIYNWQKNNWKNSAKDDILNRDLWERLIKVSSNKKIKWNHIRGHSGILENERCDEIATSFALDKKIKLFEGNFSDYKK